MFVKEQVVIGVCIHVLFAAQASVVQALLSVVQEFPVNTGYVHELLEQVLEVQALLSLQSKSVTQQLDIAGCVQVPVEEQTSFVHKIPSEVQGVPAANRGYEHKLLVVQVLEVQGLVSSHSETDSQQLDIGLCTQVPLEQVSVVHISLSLVQEPPVAGVCVHELL